MTLWNEIKSNIANDFKSKQKNFLKSNAVKKTMHFHNPKLCSRLYERVKKDPRISQIKDPQIGSPTLYKLGLSQSTLRSFYYYKLFEDTFGTEIDHITDFGAGYGNNCRVWHDLGFNGEYYLVDLPEVTELQQYYTSKTVKGNLRFMSAETLKQPSTRNGLFFATFSLDETPYEVRDMMEEKLRNYRYIFIHYNDSFPVYGRDQEEIDNVKYFKDLQKRLFKYNFYDIKDEMQMKNYMIGVKK